MKITGSSKYLPGIALVLLALAPAAGAQDIYKCTHAGTVAYTDHPCPGGKGELLHRADDSEIIDQFLRLGQQGKAMAYARSHHLEALYQQRLAAYQQQQDEKARQQADAARADQQQAEQARQQALLNQLANRNQLEAENQALRQQNDQYRGQLSQPVDNYAPNYWGAAPPYLGRSREHDHDGDHGHPEAPRAPIFHPCQQLAGGRVKC